MGDPSVGAKLRIRVMDEDFGKADDEVGTFLVPFDPVLKEEVAATQDSLLGVTQRQLSTRIAGPL